jgi:hypothetical protein
MFSSDNAARQALAFSNQTKQEVLGFNGDAAQLTGFVAGKEKYSPSPFGVPFEHPGTYVKADGVGVTGKLTTLYGMATVKHRKNLR